MSESDNFWKEIDFTEKRSENNRKIFKGEKKFQEFFKCKEEKHL